MKKIAILPTLLTLGNGVCGFAAIAYASKIGLPSAPVEIDYFRLSAYLILAAMLFDVLDGYAARLSKTASDFGGQLDSLCDAISFGAAPAFLLLRLGLDWQKDSQKPLVGQAVAMIAALYMVCAVLRLARFNLENSPDAASHKRFRGLPSPAAAGCVVSLAILRSASWSGMDSDTMYSFVRVWAPLGTLIAALLMVSRVSYPHITKQILRGRRPFSVIVQLVLALFIIALTPDLACFLLFWGYALNGLIRHVLFRLVRHQSPPPELEAAKEPHIDH